MTMQQAVNVDCKICGGQSARFETQSNDDTTSICLVCVDCGHAEKIFETLAFQPDQEPVESMPMANQY